MYRRDHALSGRSPLPGNIDRPDVLWRFPLGGSENECFPVPGDGRGADILLCYGGCVLRTDGAGRLIWKSPACGINAVGAVEDLDGDGRLEIVCSSGYEVIVLAAESGALLMRHYVGFPLSSGTQASTILCHKFDPSARGMHLVAPLMSAKEVLVFDFRDGKRHGVLAHTLWMDDAFHPTVAAADMDGDGVDELVVSKLCGLYLFDVLAGTMKNSFRWTSNGERHRNYGLLQLLDIDGDGAREVVIVAERVARHIAVIDNDGKGNLSLLWDRFVEFIYPEDTTELRHTGNSVRDVDGDGRPELIVSVYNARKDGRWWLEVIDPLTGALKFEMPDRYLWGVQDVNGDGLAEILVGVERERNPVPYSAVDIVGLRNLEPVLLWRCDNAKFAGRGLRPAGWKSNFRPLQFGHDETWTVESEGGSTVFLFTSAAGARSFAEVSFSGGSAGMRELPLGAGGEYLMQALADTDGDGAPEAVLSRNDGEIFVARAGRGILRSWKAGIRIQLEGFSAARPGPCPVVYRDAAGGTPFIAVPDNTNTLHQIHVDACRRGAAELWRRPARGWIGYDNCFHSAYVRDIDADGEYELMVVNTERRDCSELLALSPSGAVKRSWTFPGTLPPGFARIGLYEWVVVDGPRGKTITASSYASYSMNSEQTVTIDIGGKELWRKEQYGEGEWGRGVGPWSAYSVLDAEDGTKEILFLAKDLLCRVDSRTGSWKRDPWILWRATNSIMNQPDWDFTKDRQADFGGMKDPFTAYGSPLLVDVDHDGRAEILVAGCFGGFGVLRPDCSVVWWMRTPFTDMMLRHPGLADVNGDGRLCIGICRADGVFSCLDESTGREIWSIELKSTTADIAACDIDGDGKEEFIAGATDGRLLAIGADASGRGVIKWSVDLGFALGSPVIADADGDGRAEVLVVCGDGTLVCVGKGG